jgi:hypothetical protein
MKKLTLLTLLTSALVCMTGCKSVPVTKAISIGKKISKIKDIEAKVGCKVYLKINDREVIDIDNEVGYAKDKENEDK